MHGSRGTVSYIGFGTYSGIYGIDAGIERTGFLDTDEIEVAPEGLEVVEASPSARDSLSKIPGRVWKMTASLLMSRFATTTSRFPLPTVSAKRGRAGWS